MPRRGQMAAVALAAVAGWAPTPAHAADPIPGEVIVRFRAAADAGERSAARARAGADVDQVIAARRLQLLTLDPGVSPHAAARKLESSPAVLYAEPNYRAAPDALTGDPRFAEQWSFHSESAADVDAPQAWDVTMGSRDVVVALIDGGIETDHPELRGTSTGGSNLWTNPGESGAGREANGVDDDGNGRVDDVNGWSFNNGDNKVYLGSGHGSLAAGVIGAIGGDGLGMTGLSPRTRIMPLAGTSTWTVVEAIRYAAAHDVRVVSMSFNMGAYSQAVEDELHATPEALFVLSGGNEAIDADLPSSSFRYPCRSKAPNTLCVGATDHSGNLAGFSNWGARTIDLAAPGTGILTLRPLERRVFYDEFDAASLAPRWVTGGTGNTWGRSTEGSGGTAALSDSPGADYGDDVDSWAAPASAFDLSGARGCGLYYSLQHSLAPGDVLRVEASAGGSAWAPLETFTGTSWGSYRTTPLGAFDGRSSVRLRFRLTSDAADSAAGVVVDWVHVWCEHPRFRGDEYAMGSGTSLAAPHVSGAAALIAAHRPRASTAEIRDAIMSYVHPVPSLRGRTVSGGRLNARWALTGRPANLPPSPGTTQPRGDEAPAADRRRPSCRLRPARRQTHRSLRRRGYRVTIACDEAARLTTRLAAGKRVARRLGKPRTVKRVTLARTTKSLRAPGRVAVRLRLSRRMLRAVGRGRSFVLDASARDAAGNRSRVARRITLRRP